MKKIALLVCAVMGAVSTGIAWGKAPAGATGECKDGTYSEAKSKDGACSGHKGVKEWYAAPAPDKAPAGGKSTKASTDARGPDTTQPQVPSATSDRRANPQPTATPSPQPAPRATTAAAGGGSGKVWVNTNSKVYHCESDALYGKTKQGEYMTQADAKAAGARPARGKVCS